MDDPVGDQLGPVVVPADRVGCSMDGGGCKLFQLEDGHGNPQGKTMPLLYGSFGIGASFKRLIYRQRRWKYEA
ncbi:hypothetical protein [Bradyrhizobium diazoefficiens]|uniref:hypothetical protein n=1 Tax=Bradyrhizobium diazoefficiens TaxID=1355477 RepID=UPI00347F4976